MKVQEKRKQRISIIRKDEGPKEYAVILHNDDYTPMEVVVDVLITVFGMELEAAIKLMISVHNSKCGVIGTYPLEEAYDLRNKAMSYKSKYGVPLQITVDEA